MVALDWTTGLKFLFNFIIFKGAYIGYCLLGWFMPDNSLAVVSRPSIGMRQLCWHNFRNNRYVWESGIMLAF